MAAATRGYRAAMVLLFVAAAVVMLVSGFATMTVASARGHSSAAFFWIGLLLPVFGIFAAGFMPDRSRG